MSERIPGFSDGSYTDDESANPSEVDLDNLAGVAHDVDLAGRDYYLERMDAVEKVMKGSIVSPDDVRAVLPMGPDLQLSPHIPFTISELEQARQLDQVLIYRFDSDHQGNPVTLRSLIECSKSGAAGMYNVDYYRSPVGRNVPLEMRKDDRFLGERVRAGWVLTSKLPLGYSSQTPFGSVGGIPSNLDTISNQIRSSVFKNKWLPLDYRDAIGEWVSQRRSISELIEGGQQDEALAALQRLKLPSLFLPTAAEAVYDMLVAPRMLENRPSNKMRITNSFTDINRNVLVGYSNRENRITLTSQSIEDSDWAGSTFISRRPSVTG